MALGIVGVLLLVLGIGLGFTSDNFIQAIAWFGFAQIGAVFIAGGVVVAGVDRLAKQQLQVEAVKAGVPLRAVKQRLSATEIAASDRRQPPQAQGQQKGPGPTYRGGQ